MLVNLLAKPLRVGLRLILLLYTLAGLCNFAQAERLPVKNFTAADGLARNRIISLFKDSRDYLWFCTTEGISRFDGYRFTSYTVEQGLPHPQINQILETRDG